MRTIFLIQPKTGNIGNQVIALGMEQLLRKSFQGRVNLVSLPASGPQGGLSSKAVYEINRLADGLIVGPGNLFENGGLHCDLDAVSALSVPVMLFSVSMARVYDRTGLFAKRTDSMGSANIKNLCQAAEFILVRDRVTGAHLGELGIPNVRVAGCPSILLNAAAVQLPPPDPLACDAVLISVRHPKLMSVPYSIHAKIRADLCRLIELARERGPGSVRLLCHDPEDLAFAAEFPDVPMLYTENVSRFLGWLRDCRMNLTFRLHSFIPAISLGSAAIHFSYDQRAQSLISTVGLSDWDVDVVNTGDILPEVSRLWDEWLKPSVSPASCQESWGVLKDSMAAEMDAFAASVERRALALKL